MSNVKIWNWVLLFGKTSWNPSGCLKVNSWIRNSMLKEQSPTICDLYFCQYIEQTLLSDVCVKQFLWVEPIARLLQRRLELTWTPN